jgi:hypothetical protein
LALDGGEWSASRPGRFTPQGKSPWYPLDRKAKKKSKRVLFIGPQVRNVMYNSMHKATSNPTEKAVWNSFKMVTAKAESYSDTVKEKLDAFKKMGCNMSLKMHFLSLHIDFLQQIWCCQ